MTDEPPRSAAAPRPNDEPYYIDSECPDCGTDLVLWNELQGMDEENVWYDEWMCPDCEDGLYMDWPEERHEHLTSRVDEDTLSSEELNEMLAEATDSSPEGIEERAEDIDIESPEDAERVLDENSEADEL